MPLTLLVTMMVCFAFSISIAVAIGGSAVLGIALFDPKQLILVPLGELRQVAGRGRAGRPAHDLRAHLHDFCRCLGQLGGHHLCHRRDPHSGTGQTRLPGGLRRRATGHLCRAGRDHPAFDSVDPVRCGGRGVDWRAVHRRFRPGFADRRWADGVRSPVVPLQRPGQNRWRWSAGCLGRHAQRGLGAVDAGHHLGRHLWRCVHAHRSLGDRGVLRAGRGLGDPPRTQAGRHCGRVAPLGDFQRGDHVHHRQRGSVCLPHHPRRHPRRHRPVAHCGAAIAGLVFA